MGWFLSVGGLRCGEGRIERRRVEVLDQVYENLAGRPQAFVLVAVEGKAWMVAATLFQRQGFEDAFAHFSLDQVARQPGETQAAADEVGGGRQAADRPALLGTQPADVARFAAPRVADDHL